MFANAAETAAALLTKANATETAAALASKADAAQTAAALEAKVNVVTFQEATNQRIAIDAQLETSIAERPMLPRPQLP